MIPMSWIVLIVDFGLGLNTLSSHVFFVYFLCLLHHSFHPYFVSLLVPSQLSPSFTSFVNLPFPLAHSLLLSLSRLSFFHSGPKT